MTKFARILLYVSGPLLALGLADAALQVHAFAPLFTPSAARAPGWQWLLLNAVSLAVMLGGLGWLNLKSLRRFLKASAPSSLNPAEPGEVRRGGWSLVFLNGACAIFLISVTLPYLKFMYEARDFITALSAFQILHLAAAPAGPLYFVLNTIFAALSRPDRR